MKLSVCMSSYNRDPRVLDQVLFSIFRQRPSFLFEVIVIDDGSLKTSVQRVCRGYPVKYRRLREMASRRNPCVARNVAYKLAEGQFIVIQSDEVVHKTENSLERLVLEAETHSKSFVIANVLACSPSGEPWSEYTGLKRKVPYFFLGIICRKHLYSIGGNDEEFVDVLGYEDQWFADCLTEGLKLTPVYIDSVIGHHLYHPRSDTDEDVVCAKKLYLKKRDEAEKTGIWLSSRGAWDD